jgi:phosphate uptake regulator
MLKELLKIFKGDSLLDKAFQQSYEMLDITKDMFVEGTSSLRERDDNKLKTNIYDQDLAVNKYEREVRKNVFNHLTISGMEDIYSGLVLVSIIIDIERLGDYTKNIVELAEHHPKKLKGGKYEKDLKKIEEAITDSYSVVRQSFEDADTEKASALLSNYAWVNKLCDQHLIDYIKEKDDSVTTCDAVTLALYFRFLKRINSHLRNVASSVVNPFHKIGFYSKKKKKKTDH